MKNIFRLLLFSNLYLKFSLKICQMLRCQHPHCVDYTQPDDAYRDYRCMKQTDNLLWPLSINRPAPEGLYRFLTLSSVKSQTRDCFRTLRNFHQFIKRYMSKYKSINKIVPSAFYGLPCERKRGKERGD